MRFSFTFQDIFLSFAIFYYFVISKAFKNYFSCILNYTDSVTQNLVGSWFKFDGCNIHFSRNFFTEKYKLIQNPIPREGASIQIATTPLNWKGMFQDQCWRFLANRNANSTQCHILILWRRINTNYSVG